MNGAKDNIGSNYQIKLRKVISNGEKNENTKNPLGNIRPSFYKNIPLYLFGQKLYSFLYTQESREGEIKPVALLDEHTLDSVLDKFLISIDMNDGTEENKIKAIEKVGSVRKYCLFNDYIDYLDFCKNFPKNSRSFHEVIHGSKKQKPHFDIDIEKSKFLEMYPNCDDFVKESEKIKDTIIESCILVLANLGIEIKLEKNILLYTSHSDKKRSYHLIIDGYCHLDNMDAGGFYKCVMDKFMEICDIRYSTSEFYNSPFIDGNVYSSIQQLRILGCQKRDSGRPKIFQRTFMYQGKEYKNIQKEKARNKKHQKIIDLSKSLITYTYDCEILPNFVDVNDKIKRSNFSFDDLDDEITKYILKIYEQYHTLKNGMDEPIPFKFSKINGDVIELKRLHPSMCEICERVHESQNSFLFLKGEKVYWNCYQSRIGSSLIGILKIQDETKAINQENENSINEDSINEEDKNEDINEENKNEVKDNKNDKDVKDEKINIINKSKDEDKEEKINIINKSNNEDIKEEKINIINKNNIKNEKINIVDENDIKNEKINITNKSDIKNEKINKEIFCEKSFSKQNNKDCNENTNNFFIYENDFSNQNNIKNESKKENKEISSKKCMVVKFGEKNRKEKLQKQDNNNLVKNINSKNNNLIQKCISNKCLVSKKIKNQQKKEEIENPYHKNISEFDIAENIKIGIKPKNGTKRKNKK